MTRTTTTTKKASKTGSASKPPALPLTPLQQQWTTLYTTDLPKLASSKSPVQGNGNWPVTLDHCFARIILDNAVGKDKPWPQVVQPPATRNMSPVQLKACVGLAEQVARGEADLWALDEHSLKLRGKKVKSRPSTAQAATSSNPKKRKSVDAIPESSQRPPEDDDEAPAAKKTRKQEAAEGWSAFTMLKSSGTADAGADADNDDEAEALPDIQHIVAACPDLTPFRREALRLLTQVPRGRYTTYQAISDAMSPAAAATKDKARASGCARAVGMAMRTNPFAPTVPCHRVLASDGKIGGFKGDWGTEGRFYNEKMRLLTEEGVKFDAKGVVIGKPFRGFT